MIIDTGKQIEDQLTRIKGIYNGLVGKRKYSSSFILKSLYIALSIISFLLSIYLFILHKAWTLVII